MDPPDSVYCSNHNIISSPNSVSPSISFTIDDTTISKEVQGVKKTRKERLESCQDKSISDHLTWFIKDMEQLRVGL